MNKISRKQREKKENRELKRIERKTNKENGIREKEWEWSKVEWMI